MADQFIDLPRKSLPRVPPYLALLGPGLVWMALAQGSGELIWWPYVVAKYGLAFMFLLIPACLLQFPLTFEIGRYTLLTGEGVFKGFFRLNRGFGIFLWVLFSLSFLWFGAFTSAGGTAIAALTGFPHDGIWAPASFVPTDDRPEWWTARHQTLFWAQTSIVVFTLAILWVKTVYRLIEWVMKIVAIVSLVGVVAACCHPTVRSAIGEFLGGLVTIDVSAMRQFDLADASKLLTAITFAGLGGFWTLFYSYWIKEKGAGMAAHIEPIRGFRSGVAAIRAGEPALPEDNAEAGPTLRRWYRYLRIETLVGIVGNLITTLLMCLLAFALLHPEGRAPEDFRIAVEQAEFFAVSWGNAGRLLFLFIAGAFLADTWLASADCVARIHLDALGTMFPRVARSNQRTGYYLLVIILAVITSITMYFNRPGPLIVVSAVIGFAGTVIYSCALIALNHFRINQHLPADMRSGRWPLAMIAFVTLCYLALATAYVWVQGPIWVKQFTEWRAA